MTLSSAAIPVAVSLTIPAGNSILPFCSMLFPEIASRPLIGASASVSAFTDLAILTFPSAVRLWSELLAVVNRAACSERSPPFTFKLPVPFPEISPSVIIPTLAKPLTCFSPAPTVTLRFPDKLRDIPETGANNVVALPLFFSVISPATRLASFAFLP